MICTGCGVDKDENQFAWKRFPTKRRTQCKRCVLEYQRQHYRRSAKRRADIKRANERYQMSARQAVWDYLATHPCVDCGEKDVLVLEFDHRDAATKTLAVSAMIDRALSVAKIMAEIEKCDVRCANCHRRRTRLQFGWRVPANSNSPRPGLVKGAAC